MSEEELVWSLTWRGDEGHQPLVSNLIEEVLQVEIHHPFLSCHDVALRRPHGRGGGGD